MICSNIILYIEFDYFGKIFVGTNLTLHLDKILNIEGLIA